MSANLLPSIERYLAAVKCEQFASKGRRMPEWRRLRMIADQASPRLRKAFLLAVGKTVNGTVQQEIVDAIARGSLRDAAAAVPWDRYAEPVIKTDLMDAFTDAFTKAGRLSATVIQGVEPFKISVVDDRPLQFVKDQGAAKVKLYGDTNREAIQDSLARSLDKGFTPLQTALSIVPAIGLLPRYAAAVDKERNRLLDEGKSFAEASAVADRYAGRLLKARAMMIARTESQDAVQHGQTEAWSQAVDRGLVDPAESEEEWLTAEDEVVCEICGPMDGDRVPLGEQFTTGDGRTVNQPGSEVHPGCRCSRILRTGE